MGLIQKLLSLLLAIVPISGTWAQTSPQMGLNPGFYLVEDVGSCHSKYGKIAFVFWHRPSHKIDFKTSLGKSSKGLFQIQLINASQGNWVIGDAKDQCLIRFKTASLQPLGICSDLQAHRGDTRIFPANSMEAFNYAMEQGFTGFELDIQLSKDGVAVVNHDERIGPSSDCKGRFSDKNWDEIKNCKLTHSPLLPNVGIFGKKALVESKIPNLGQVFKTFYTDTRLKRIHIDIKPKNRPQELVVAIKNALADLTEQERFDLEPKLTFIAKDMNDIDALRSAFPRSHIAFESDASISGIIDRPDKNYWGPEHCAYDTLSVAYGTQFNLALQIAKILRGEGTGDATRFKRLYRNNRDQENMKRMLGWTLNAKSGIRNLRTYQIEDVLTDLNMNQIVEMLYEGVSEELILGFISEIEKNGRISRCRNLNFQP